MSFGPRGASRLGLASLLVATPFATYAVSFDLGPVDARLDSTLTVGAIMRMEDPDPALIGIANSDVYPGTQRTINNDDGNLGFEKGDLVSATIKGTHELEFMWENIGLFTRFSYFYDKVADDADHREDRFNEDGYAIEDREFGQYELGERGRDRLVSEVDLLDLFLYGNFRPGGKALTVRAGNQVVSWGESTFIGNSINVVNPYDVSRLRLPGSELKEGLIPTPMIWGAFDVNASLSLEALWMTSYQETMIDPRGAYFSTTDVVSDDSNMAVVTLGRRQDTNTTSTWPSALAVYGTLPPPLPEVIPESPFNPTNPAFGFEGAADAMAWLPRGKNINAEDGTKQFGLAARYFATNLRNTQFGFYYLNYHSRVPFFSVDRAGGAVNGGVTNISTIMDPDQAGYVPTCADVTAETLSTNVFDPATGNNSVNCRAQYYVDYPSNIDLFGISFNTDGPFGSALQGEWSYRPNQPLGLPGTDMVLVAVGQPNTVTGTGYIDDSNTPEAAAVAPGTVIHGYERVDMHQWQMTLTKAFGPQLGATQSVFLGEVGLTYYDLPDGIYFAGSGTNLPSPGAGGRVRPCTDDCALYPAYMQAPSSIWNPDNPPTAREDGFASGGGVQYDGWTTSTSWGYRLVGRLDYENVFGPVGISPRAVFSHDVNGNGQTFNEDAKSFTFGLAFNYLQRWQADLSYTAFFGGDIFRGEDTFQSAPGAYVSESNPDGQPFTHASHSNPVVDRDFLALSLSYAF